MKKIILILLVVAAVVWAMTNREQVDGYAKDAKQWFDETVLKKAPPEEKPEEEVVVVEKTPTPAPVMPVVEEERKPKIAPAPPAPAPLASTLAEGFYYTKERVSQVNDLGVAAIPKGVKVKKLGEQNGAYVITDGTVEVSAEPIQLTRDDAEIAILTKPVEAPKPAEVKKAAPTAAPTATTAASAPKSNKPHPEIPGLKTRIMALDDQIYKLRGQLADLQHAREYSKVRGRVTSEHVRIPQVQAQIDQAIAERQRVAARLFEIQ